MYRLFALLIGLLPLAGPLAHAQMNATIVFDGGRYIGPGDKVSYTAWWGLRGYSQAFAQPGTGIAIRIVRDSDSTETDIVILSDGNLDVAAADSFCSATTCKVRTIYDQTAGGACSGSCDLVQATAGNRPLLVLTGGGGSGTRPYLQCGPSQGGCELASVGTYTADASNLLSISYVGLRVGAGAATNRLVGNQAANAIGVIGGVPDVWGVSGVGNSAGTDDAWHATNGTITDVAFDTINNTDGSETSGTGTVNNTAGVWKVMDMIGTAATLRFGEAGFQDDANWSAASRTSLCHNQRLYWGIAGTC